MTDYSSDRRTSAREKLKTPIRVHIWKSAIPEELGESENLSEKGILFATDSVIPVGTALEILLNYAGEDQRRADERMALLRTCSTSRAKCFSERTLRRRCSI